jgi:hypothetical protein
LAHLERHVPLLPVPISDAKERFLQRLQNEPLPTTARATVFGPRLTWRRMMVGFGSLAAAAAIITGGVFLGSLISQWRQANRENLQVGAAQKTSAPQAGTARQPAPPSATKTFLARLMDCELRLAEADAPRQRVEALTDMADALEQEAVAQAAAREVVATLAQLYEKVVGDGVVRRPRHLPPANQGAVLATSSAEAARQFQRDRLLVVALVEGGLRLAVEEDALKRADACSRLADPLARAIKQAALDKDAGRATSLGYHLKALLIQGVARNVGLARKTMLTGSPREAELRRLGEQTVRFTKPAEEGLSNLAAGDPEQIAPVLLAVHQGRAEVERAVYGKPAAGNVLSTPRK